MPNLLDVFDDDAFSMVALTDAINKVDHVPGQAGELAFAGNGVGVPTTDVMIEYKDTALTIIPTSPRGGPAPQEIRDKAKAFKLEIPQIKVEDTIGAHCLQNVRAFGNGDLVAGAESVVREQMTKMAQRMDLTLEHLRLGALKGKVLDADGSEIVDLYSAFGVSEPNAITFPALSSETSNLRVVCQQVAREISKAAKLMLPKTAQVVAFCGDSFFDQLVSHPDAVVAFQGWQAAQQKLTGDVRSGFVYGDIMFINYRGTDGVTGEESSEGDLVGEVGIATGEARLFLTGVPGLYTEKYAPPDFLDSVNVVGLPRYARQWPIDGSNRAIKLHVQSNPLPICTRPATLLKGVFG